MNQRGLKVRLRGDPRYLATLSGGDVELLIYKPVESRRNVGAYTARRNPDVTPITIIDLPVSERMS